MFNQVDYTIVYVSNMGRSIEFYRDILGLKLKTHSEDWTEFQSGTGTLALHAGGKPQEFNHAAGGKREPLAGTCHIGFSVDNVDTVYEKLKSKGMKFVMPPTKFEDDKIKLAVGIDPDGLGVSLCEAL